MAHEVWLVDADVLDRDNTLGADQFRYPVDQQKRITVREDLQDFLNVEPRGYFDFGRRGIRGVGSWLVP